jgi:single-strand DNA-binding protein
MSLNRFICTGNLTKDPELRELQSGTTVCDLRIAVDGMGRGAEHGFINVNVYGRPGQAAAEYLTKGWLVAVDGRLEFTEWGDEQSGKRHDYTVVGNVDFLSAPRVLDSDSDSQPSSSRKRARQEPVAA